MKSGYPARYTLKIYIVLAVIFGLVGCQTVSPTLKIGLVAPFEGLHRPLGYEALFAVKLAVQQRNAAGGVNGRQVELVALNDFDDPVEAQTQAKALLADPAALGVVGHLSSDTTLAALPIYQAADLAVSVPWTMAAAVNQAGVVSVAATADEMAARLDTFRRERGFNTVVTVSQTNFGAIPAQAQAIMITGDGVKAGEIVLALRQAGVSLPLLGLGDAGSPQLAQVAHEAANGLVFVSPGPAPVDVGATEFAQAYQALAGFPPGPRAVLAYDAANVLLDAIAAALRTGQPDRAAVSAEITSVRRRGLSGELAFNAQGQRINAPVWVYQISGEEYPGVLMAP